jgi:hypothetical protein
MPIGRLVATAFMLSGVLAWAQSEALQSVTIPLRNGQTESEMSSIAIAVRTAAGIPKLSLDTSNSAITFSGTLGQLELVRSLIAELDQPSFAPIPDNSAGRGYPVPDGGAHQARVFYVKNAANPQAQQEVMVTLRTLEDIHSIFPYWSRRALVMRGTRQQLEFASWLISEIDRRTAPQADISDGPAQYQFAGSDEFARIFFLKPPQSPQQLQQKFIAIRSQANINRAFPITAAQAIAARGTAAQLQLAEQAIKAHP